MPFKRHNTLAKPLSRRRFLTGIAATAAGFYIPNSMANQLPLQDWLARSQERERSIALHHLHTGERLKLTYWAEGEYLGDSLAEINHMLRDFRTGESHPIDPVLFDMLHLLRQRIGRKGAFDIISAYRSPKTNAMLRNNSSGVAKRSLHMEGKALDIRLPGYDLHKLHQQAVALKAGGVGLYTGSNFVHIDTGRVRYWGS